MTRIEASLPPRWHLIEPSPVIRGIMRFISVRTAWLGPKLILIFNVNQLVAIAFFHTDVPHTSFRPPLRQSPAVPHSQHISNGSKYTYLVSEDETGRRQAWAKKQGGEHWVRLVLGDQVQGKNIKAQYHRSSIFWSLIILDCQTTCFDFWFRKNMVTKERSNGRQKLDCKGYGTLIWILWVVPGCGRR